MGVGGRPPKLFTSEKAEELGKDLFRWVNTEGATNFIWVEWYHNKHGMFRSDWKSLIQRPEFLPYYELARQVMASNMVKNKEVHHSYGHRYLALYDDELLDHELGVKKKEAEIKSSESETLTSEDWKAFQKVHSHIYPSAQLSESKSVAENHSC